MVASRSIVAPPAAPVPGEADQPAAGRGQALEPLALARHLARLPLPQGRRGLVESLKEVPCGLWRRDAVAEQERERRVLAQMRQVLATLAACRPQREQSSTNAAGGSPRLQRLIAIRSSTTGAAPLTRNASIRSGTPPCAVSAPASAR
jgi:hypothetical protein